MGVASAITDIYYLVHRQIRDKGNAKKLMKELLTVVSVARVSEQEIESALSSLTHVQTLMFIVIKTW